MSHILFYMTFIQRSRLTKWRSVSMQQSRSLCIPILKSYLATSPSSVVYCLGFSSAAAGAPDGSRCFVACMGHRLILAVQQCFP